MFATPNSQSADRRLLRLLPGFCLFLSGAASLTYELTWIRELTLVYGGTLYAISAVLCAFMSGLALGAWCLSRWLRGKDTRGLFRLYGYLEGAIGLYGLAFPWILDLTTPLYPVFVAIAGGSDAVLHLLEFLWGALLMLPATFLMGATLPVLGTWAIGGKADTIQAEVSWLYGMNTAGAVAGCLLTQFLALRWFGVSGTTWMAVATNALVFLLCMVFEPDTIRGKSAVAEKTPPPAQESISTAASGFLLALFGFSGMVALSSEILWTRVLVIPLGSSLYSFALILAAFLFGIAAGSLCAHRLFRKPSQVRTFLLLEAGVGILGLLMIPLLDQVTPLTSWLDARFYDPENTALRTLWLRSGLTFLFMFPPAFVFGLIFPVANQIQLDLFGQVPTTLGGSYTVNTLGSILGTVLTPFVFIPLFGIERSLFILFGALLLLAGCAPLLIAAGKKEWRLLLPPSLLALLTVAWLVLDPGVATQRIGKNNLTRVDFGTSFGDVKLVDYLEGNFSTLSVVEDTKRNTRTLFVNGFSTATVSEKFGGTSYMQAMGLVPALLHPDPKRALVMCFGTGNTLGTVARFPGIQVDAVEIDRNVLSLAHWFSPWNGNVLDRDNVAFHIQDARQFIRWDEGTYDVITLEPMHPAHAGVSALYSLEFYEQAKARLKTGGIFMQWLPLHLLNEDDSLAILKTFREAFPHTSLWNSFLTRIVLLVGSSQPVALDPQNFLKRMQNSAVAQAGSEIGVRSFLDFLDFYVTDADALDGILRNQRIITDDRTLIEHSSVNLLPPFPRETDETFLNFLLRRIGAFPEIKNLDAEQLKRLKHEFDTRTGQRLSIFSQRYSGPGAEEFRSRRFMEGLEKVAQFRNKHPDAWITLSDQGWSARQAPQ